ncbi:MAG: hypothetical protein AAB197_00725, partial [Deltaproteobacteria bacterium]
MFLLATVVTVSPVQASEIAPANGPVGIIIMPFTIYSKDDLSGFRRELLNTLASGVEEGGKFKIVGIERLKMLVQKEKIYSFDEASASKIGKDEGAAFAILGSITKIDKAISLDIRLLDIAENRLITSLYMKEENEKTIL